MNIEKIDHQLKALGSLLRSQPSVTEEGLHQIQDVTPVKPRRSFWGLPLLARPGLGVAACLLVSLCLWFFMTLPSTVTLAEVQEAVKARPWVQITYEDGDKKWANLQDRRSFYTYNTRDDRNFHVGMRDHIRGLWRYYHRNWGEQIHESPFTPRAYPETPWEYALGGLNDRGRPSRTRKTVETFPDKIEGREVVRFDTYDVGPAGLRTLAEQVWADPQSRLPIRLREFDGRNREVKSQTGEFSFPEIGPTSIYELGAPAGLPTVVNWGVMDPQARTIMKAAEEALNRLPRNMRVVEKGRYSVLVGYRMGNRLRVERYGSHTDDNRDRVSCEYPEGLKDVRAWAAENLTLVEIRIFDRDFFYTYRTGKGLEETWESVGGALRVQYRDEDWIDVELPLRDMWPYRSNVGPLIVSTTDPNAPAGCVLLQYRRDDLRRDWFVDPQRDYICVKQREYRKEEGSGRWIESEFPQTDRLDLRQLPSGQWYARTAYLPLERDYPTEYEITPMTESDLRQQLGPDEYAEFFNGEQLIAEAREKNLPIAFWGR